MPEDKTIPGAEAKEVHLEISARNSLAPVVRFFVHAVIMDAGFSQEFSDEVELALDEALTNIIEHTYHDDGVSQIVLRLDFRPGEVALSLRDFGKPYNPLNNPEVDMESYLEKNSVGGLGVHLIKKLMTEVDYLPEGDKGNLLVMRKRISGS